MSIETNNNVIADADHPRVGLFIDGEWIFDRPSCFEVLDPSTEASLTSVPGATTADLKRVLAAAERGFKIWRDTPPAERNIIISRAIAGVRSRSEEIAQIITRENGKLIADADRKSVV